LFFNYAFSEKWYLATCAGVFTLVGVGDFDRTVWDVFAGIEYRPWQHIGLGLAYIHNSADLEVTNSGQNMILSMTIMDLYYI
jgi:hypothetical protein